jgi:hypothetical protein
MGFSLGKGSLRRAALAALLLLSGCVTVRFDQPVANLGAATADASAAIGEYLRALDDFERRVYLDACLYDPREGLAASQGGRPTPLLARRFGPESIRARTDALSLLGAYAQRLDDLVNTDAPAKATDAAAALGSELGNLAERVQTLAGDATAPDYAGPVSALVAVVGELYVEERRERALRKGIAAGGPQAARIIDLLEKDLVEAVKPLRETGEAERLAERVRWYNERRGELARDLAARRALLDDIDETVRRSHAIADFDPTRVTRALRGANDALLALARSSRKPGDLRAFAAAMRAWGGRIAAAAQAARSLGEKEE